MTASDVIFQLKQIIAERLDVRIKYSEIREDISFFEDGLGLDSIALVEFVTLVEEVFQLRFSEDDLNAEVFSSIQSVALRILERMDQTVRRSA